MVAKGIVNEIKHVMPWIMMTGDTGFAIGVLLAQR